MQPEEFKENERKLPSQSLNQCYLIACLEVIKVHSEYQAKAGVPHTIKNTAELFRRSSQSPQ